MQHLSDQQSIKAYSFAEKLYQKREYVKSLEILTHLTSLYPKTYAYWFSLSSCLQALEDYESAVKGWAITHVLHESDPYPLYYAAVCYFSLNQKHEAYFSLTECEKLTDSSHQLSDSIDSMKKLIEAYDTTS